MLAGVSSRQGAGATRGARAVMGWCVEGAAASRCWGAPQLSVTRRGLGVLGGLEEDDAVLAGRRTWAGGEGRFAVGRDL